MEIRDDELDLYSLQHHGVKDQKWGVTHGPPYPLDRNAARQARKKEKAERKAQRQEERQKAKKRKQQAERLKKARAARAKKKEEEAREEAKRKKTLKNPETIYKNRNRYSYTMDEINQAMANFAWQEKIQQYSSTRLATTTRKAENFVKLFKSGIDGYNTVASVYNTWFPDDAQLPVIRMPSNDGGGDKKKNKSGGGNQNQSSNSGSGNQSSNQPRKSEGINSLEDLRALSKKNEDEKKKKGGN